jgi:pyrroloquinoline quinone (PQQ) biosynthesis protein C
MLNKNILKLQKIDLTKSYEPSENLIYSGSANDFIKSLCIETLNHEAVNHPYLKKFFAVEIEDKKKALRDYAYQYSHYSKAFPIYCKNVVDRLEVKKHKDILLENYYEELGKPDSEKFEDWPHQKMFNSFAEEVGVTKEYRARQEICMTAKIWRQLFDEKCKTTIPGVGMGAIGIATEFIVPHIYSYLIPTIKAEKTLSSRCSYFFKLHTECDVEHGNEIIECAIELAKDSEAREGIRFGTLSSLNLRKTFWDVMNSRLENKIG